MSDIQPPSTCFSSADGKPIDLTGMYRGRSAFLVCGGPSFAKMPGRVPRILKRPGFLTMGVNNSAKAFRPDLWCCVDEPDHFIRSVFLDPRIMKFCPVGKREKSLWHSDKWYMMDTKTRECPNVRYFCLTHDGFPGGFMTRPDFFWGFDKDNGGGRSVMHVAVKLLYVLGIRRIFLLGADFHMTESERYSFVQHRARGSVKGNNSTYAKLNERFTILRPQFEAAGLQVFNCTPGSHLDAFERMDFMDAADIVQGEFGVNTKGERTYGLYERASCEKNVKKWREKKDAALEELRPHVAKMHANPGKAKFENRVGHKVEKFFQTYRRMIAFDNEAVTLETWKD